MEISHLSQAAIESAIEHFEKQMEEPMGIRPHIDVISPKQHDYVSAYAKDHELSFDNAYALLRGTGVIIPVGIA